LRSSDLPDYNAAVTRRRLSGVTTPSESNFPFAIPALEDIPIE
jgi:hypothetical protein